MSDPFSGPAPLSPSSSASRQPLTLSALLDRLGGAVSTETDGYLCACPGHPDSHASLRVALAESGAVLLKCRAGCSTPDVAAAAGLTMSELFDVEPGAAPRVAASDAAPLGISDVAALKTYLDRAAAALLA